jgi:hypothetical protein
MGTLETSDAEMTFSDRDLSHIGQYVRAELPRWLNELAPMAIGSQLIERAVRVEEELRSQRELLLQHMRSSDRHFDDVNKRFEDNKRHTTTQWFVATGMVILLTAIALAQFLG